MADLNLTVDADTSKAISGLDKLTSSIDKVHAKFTGLGAKIAGLGFAAFTGKVIAMADELQDLSNASGIAVGRLVELQKALAVTGGEASMMPAAVNQFVRSLDEAASGSIKAQDAFRQAGISLQDLGKLSEQELLQGTLEGISKIDDAGRRASIMMNLFGKSFKTVDPKELSDRLKETAGSADKYAESIKRAAELNDQMVTAQGALKMAFLEAFSPVLTKIVDFNNAMAEGKKSTETLVTIIKALAVALSIAFAFTGWGLIVRAIGTIGRGVGALTTLFGGAGKAISQTFGATGKVMTALRGVGGLVAAIAAGIGTILGLTSDAEDKAGNSQTDTANEQAKAQADAARKVADALEKKRHELERVTESFKKQSAEVIDNINLDNQLIGKSKEYQDTVRAQEALFKRAADEVDKLRKSKEDLSEEEQRGGMGAVIDQQIAKIQEATKVEAERIQRAVHNNNVLQQAEQVRLFGIQQQIEMTKQLQGVQDDMAKLTMTELEKKYYDIEAASKASAKAAIEAEEARRGAKLSTEEQQKYYDIATAGNDRLKQQQSELYQKSREFSTGWQQAFNEYIDNATNAANKARDMFNAVTNNMNSAIDNFVDNGKFSFSDLASSIIRDLIKIELKASAMQLWKMMGSGGGSGGMLAGLGSMLGFAEGGNPPIGKASIVGENGPELIVPRTASTVIPNGAGQQQAPVYNITNNISAVDAAGVARLLTNNRQLLLGTIEQARKESPSMGR